MLPIGQTHEARPHLQSRTIAAPTGRQRPSARVAAGEPGVGNQRNKTADWPNVQAALHTQ